MASYTDWALTQIEEYRLANTGEPKMAYETLAKSLVAAFGGGGQMFGMPLDKFDELPRLQEAIVGALCEYKAHYAAAEMTSWLLELDGFAKRFGIDALRSTRRFPLRCDPLGSRELLSEAWQARLARLDAACAGTARIDHAAVGFEGEVEAEVKAEVNVRFGAPDNEALYRVALGFEHDARATFPRELAAWWTTANGIFIDDTPFLAPVHAWRADEIGDLEGLRIGDGASHQGSLFLVGDLERGIEALRVVQTDDEVETRAYRTFGELADRLLGR